MRVETSDSAALLVLEAGRANAMNEAFLDGLERLLAEAASATAIVLTGYGNFFSAGLDLPTLIDFDRTRMRSLMNRFRAVMGRLFSLPIPVVAAVNGHAIAGGCVLALQADVRVMTSQPAKIGLNEIALGVGLPAEVVETARCQLPAATFTSMCLTGVLLSPEEALRSGLVHELVDPAKLRDIAMARAAKLASPGYAQVKHAVRAPVLRAIAETAEPVLEAWLDTWFSASTRGRLAAAVAALKAPGRESRRETNS